MKKLLFATIMLVGFSIFSNAQIIFPQGWFTTHTYGGMIYIVNEGEPIYADITYTISFMGTTSSQNTYKTIVTKNGQYQVTNGTSATFYASKNLIGNLVTISLMENNTIISSISYRVSDGNFIYPILP